MNDLRAELLVFIDTDQRFFDFCAAYVRDGGIANVGWESAGIFPSVHDALECGMAWLKDAKANGFKRGSNTIAWRKAA